MKNLIIMRHAKSEWDNSSLSDFDRPLNERGLKSAPFMGNELLSRNKIPDLIISSPANRAKTTAIMVAKACGFKSEIILVDEFYFGSLDEIFKIVKNTDNNLHTVMLVGHNPTWESLVVMLSKESKNIVMPTAAIASLVFDIRSWKDIKQRTADLEFLLMPRELMG